MFQFEDDVSIQIIYLYTGAGGYWLGLNDIVTQMTFKWTDGSPVSYTHWHVGEPNNYANRHEDCVMINLAVSVTMNLCPMLLAKTNLNDFRGSYCT